MPNLDTPPPQDNIRPDFITEGSHDLMSSYFGNVRRPAQHEIDYIRKQYREQEVECALYNGIDDRMEREKYRWMYFTGSLGRELTSFVFKVGLAILAIIIFTLL